MLNFIIKILIIKTSFKKIKLEIKKFAIIIKKNIIAFAFIKIIKIISIEMINNLAIFTNLQD